MENDDGNPIEVESMSPLQSHYTDSYPIESRRNMRNNMFKVYSCACGQRKHHSRQQMNKHRRKCKGRLQIKRRQHWQQEEENILAQVEYHGVDREIHQDLQNIKNRLAAIEYQQGFCSNRQIPFSAYMKAKQFYQRYSSSIQGILINKIACSLENAVKANIKVLQIENIITAAILNKLQAINFDDCIQVFSEKLAQAHRSIVEESQNKTAKTKQYNQRAFDFLSMFNQFQLSTHVVLFDELLKLDATQRKNVYRYWSLVRNIEPYFAKFPLLPKLFKTIPRGVMLSQTTIEDAGKEVRQIYLEGQRELATDMWVVICLGLRYHDLLKLCFFQQGRIVKTFKMKQKKNKNICMRFVPVSLIEMMLGGKVQYPLNEIRLRKAVRECLRRFNSSYGFKHRAITIILTALHRSNPFARMHSHASMTANHYLDQNDEQFINRAFSINIKFQFGERQSQMIKDRNLHVDYSNEVPVFTQIQQYNSIEISLDCSDIVYSRLESAALDGFSQNSNILEQGSSKELQQISLISSRHQAQLLPQRHQKLEEALSTVDKESRVVDAAEQLAVQQGKQVSDQLLIKKTSSLIGSSIVFYDFDNDNNPQPLRADYLQQQRIEVQSQLIISKNKKGYALSSENIPVIVERLAAIEARQRMTPQVYYHKPIAPRCWQCWSAHKYAKLVSIEEGIQCSKCGWNIKKPGRLYPLKDSVRFSSSSNSESNFYPCVRLMEKKNNLIQVVDELYPGKFARFSKYSQDFPDQIQSSYSIADKRFCKEITNCRKKLEYLPLEIRSSSISGAGRGIFAVQDIEEGRLILIYQGLFGTSFSLIDKEANDSLFELGWVICTKRNSKEAFEVIVDGIALVGPARFINSSSNSKEANCMAFATICNNALTICFATTKHVHKNTELTFFYGNNYWKQKAPNKEPEYSEDEN